MLFLFTDFGPNGPYLGQVRAVIENVRPGLPVIDLVNDAPGFDPRAAAYLLAALVPETPAECVILAVVDPGVGGSRAPVVLGADGRWLVGPDNGLLAMVARDARSPTWWDITWRGPRLSATFHGRDLFAPVAARLAAGEAPPGTPRAAGHHVGGDWPRAHASVIYVDHYGNAMTGVCAASVAAGTAVSIAGHTVAPGRTFGDVPPGEAIWYENSCGLMEIAVNQGRADRELGLAVGTPVSFVAPARAVREV